MKEHNERFTLVLEASPDAIPPEVRLRRLLKTLWRSHRLRVVRAESVEREDEQADDDFPF